MSDLQNRLTTALGREVNLNHEKVHEIVFELVGKLEQYQSGYQDTVKVIQNTVKAIQKHYAEGEEMTEPNYYKSMIDSYEKKLKAKDKQVKRLEEHNKWLIDKVNELGEKIRYGK